MTITKKKEEIFSQYPDTIEGIGRAMRDPRMIAAEKEYYGEPSESYKTHTGRLAHQHGDREILLLDLGVLRDQIQRSIDKIKEIRRDDGDTESSRERIGRLKEDKAIIKKDARNLLEDLHTFDEKFNV